VVAISYLKQIVFDTLSNTMTLMSLRFYMPFCLLLLISHTVTTLAKSPSLIPKSNKPKLASALRIRKISCAVFKSASSSNHNYNNGKSEAAWVSGMKNSLASAMAAASSKIILAPFDTLKTLQQHSQSSISANPLSLIDAAQVIIKRPRGILEFYVSTIGWILSINGWFENANICNFSILDVAVRLALE
jgi:hypothetical protein